MHGFISFCSLNLKDQTFVYLYLANTIWTGHASYQPGQTADVYRDQYCRFIGIVI